MTPVSVATYWVRIYMSGPVDVAKQAIRAECARQGLCVTVDPTCFIYSGGEEAGLVVQLINYPRFPQPAEAIWARGEALARCLREALHQHSVLLMDPTTTLWLSVRVPGSAA